MTRVKICGVTRLEDARLAAEFGAFAIGFVFWPKSPRFVERDRARAIRDALPAHVLKVGVFVNQAVEEIATIAAAVPLDAVQLHGDESPDFVRAIPAPVIKAVAVRDGFAVESLDVLPDYVTVLLDAHDPVRRGGTGQTIDWTLAAAAAARRPIILSGGLEAGNIGAAIAQVKPYGVDLSSGVESTPGVKDPARLRALFEAVRHG